MDISRDKRSGIVLVLVLAVLGGVFHWRGQEEIAYGIWLVGLCALLISLISPTVMRYPRKGLLAIGWLNSQLVLVLAFYLVLTPMGLVMRLLGRDPLNRKGKDKRESYWISRETVTFDPLRLEKPY